MNIESCIIRADSKVPPWSSGRGQQVGSMFGELKTIAKMLAQPFILDEELLAAYSISPSVGLVVVGLELSYLSDSDKLLAGDLSILSIPTFYDIYIDAKANPLLCKEEFMQYDTNELKVDYHF